MRTFKVSTPLWSNRAHNNNAPVAIDDAATLSQVEPVVIDAIANDWDPDGDAIWIETVSNGTKGTVTINPDGSLTYTPGRRFKNKDSFSYTVGDGSASTTATVSIALTTSSGGGGGNGGGGNGGGGNGGGKPNR
jgi:hypothetical protein